MGLEEPIQREHQSGNSAISYQIPFRRLPPPSTHHRPPCGGGLKLFIGIAQTARFPYAEICPHQAGYRHAQITPSPSAGAMSQQGMVNPISDPGLLSVAQSERPATHELPAG